MILTDPRTQFEQAKLLMKAIWMKYDDDFGYRSEKFERIDAAKSIESGYGLVQMFDYKNQAMFFAMMGDIGLPIPEDWKDLL